MNGKALLAEFFGVFALCFFGILAIHFSGPAASGLVGVALAHGLAIMVMVAAFAAISGAHFNPAVSFAMLITKRIDITTFMGYVIAQIMGGAIASVVAGMVVTPAIVGAGTPAVGAGLTSTGALIAEIVGTMFLVLTIFGAAVDKRNSGQAPIYIGLAIVGIILAVGPASGAALNPARYIGPAIVGGKFGPDFWVWIVGPLAGAAIAALLFEHFFFKNEPAAEA